LKKNLDSVRNEFGLVRFKNAVWFGYYSYLLLAIPDITAAVDDMTLTPLYITHNNDNK